MHSDKYLLRVPLRRKDAVLYIENWENKKNWYLFIIFIFNCSNGKCQKYLLLEKKLEKQK